MTSPSWDPDQYLAFAAPRARPFHDLVDRIAVADPRRVVDLGCGPGTLTVTLRDRWAHAGVLGLDSSPTMIEAAGRLAGPRLEFALGDIATWTPDGPLDVIVSNAALQWVPGHQRLLPGWVGALAPGGALAVQVPASQDSSAARVFAAVAGSPRWARRLGDLPGHAGPSVPPLDSYLDLLTGLGCRVDAWRTTYHHVLTGPDPVLDWFAGTGLRPYLDRLDGADEAAFRAEVAAGLREAYPARPYGTVLPFTRLFVVAYR
jgi:trans-aconitate 2-methyltransferase